jgi:alpha-acetolactate decarboxylase
LIQIYTCTQVNNDAFFINIAGLFNTTTEKRMAEAIRERGYVKFTEAMAHLPEIRFANLLADA